MTKWSYTFSYVCSWWYRVGGLLVHLDRRNNVISGVLFVSLLFGFCSFSLTICCSVFNGTVCVLICLSIKGLTGGSTSIFWICQCFLNVVRPEPSGFMKYCPVSTIVLNLFHRRVLAFCQSTVVPIFVLCSYIVFSRCWSCIDHRISTLYQLWGRGIAASFC